MNVLTKPEVLTRLRLSARKLEMMVDAGEFPPPVRVGKSNYWSVLAVENWEKRTFEFQENWNPIR